MSVIADDPNDAERRIPIVAEEIHVDKVEVTTDHVRVSTSVEYREVLVEEELECGILHVERIPVERQVETAPEPRQEGDTTIISLVEERLVVETRLFVVEEIHVTREARREHVAIPVTLRSTRATIERPMDEIPTGSETNG